MIIRKELKLITGQNGETQCGGKLEVQKRDFLFLIFFFDKGEKRDC